MSSAHPARKEKIKHELKEMLMLSLYLAFFFCAIALYENALGLISANASRLPVTSASRAVRHHSLGTLTGVMRAALGDCYA